MIVSLTSTKLVSVRFHFVDKYLCSSIRVSGTMDFSIRIFSRTIDFSIREPIGVRKLGLHFGGTVRVRLGNLGFDWQES